MKKIHIDCPQELIDKIEAAIKAGRAPHKKAFFIAAVENFLGLPLSVPAVSSRTRNYKDPLDEVTDCGLTVRELEEQKERFDYNRRIWLALKYYGFKPVYENGRPTGFPPGHVGLTLDYSDPDILKKLPPVDNDPKDVA